MTRPPPRSTLFPYTTLSRSRQAGRATHRHGRHARHARESRLGVDASAHQSADRALPRRAMSALLEIHDVAKRSEEHTSELQSQSNLVCRLLLEKKQHSDLSR